MDEVRLPTKQERVSTDKKGLKWVEFQVSDPG